MRTRAILALFLVGTTALVGLSGVAAASFFDDHRHRDDDWRHRHRDFDRFHDRDRFFDRDRFHDRDRFFDRDRFHDRDRFFDRDRFHDRDRFFDRDRDRFFDRDFGDRRFRERVIVRDFDRGLDLDRRDVLLLLALRDDGFRHGFDRHGLFGDPFHDSRFSSLERCVLFDSSRHCRFWWR